MRNKSIKKTNFKTKELVTSSPARTQLASCAPRFTSSTTTVSLSHLHHFFGNSLTDFVSDDSEAKALLCVYKISGIKKSRYSRPMTGWTKHEASGIARTVDTLEQLQKHLIIKITIPGSVTFSIPFR